MLVLYYSLEVAHSGAGTQLLLLARMALAGPNIKALTMRMLTKFTTKPGITMSPKLNTPVEKAIALGGVAIGSMKASDDAKAAGSMYISGLTLA